MDIHSNTFLAPTLFAFIVLFLGSHTAFTPPRDYCNKTLCRNGRSHIGCNHEGWARNCVQQEKISFNLNLMKTAVHHHNFYREKVAVGDGTTRNERFPKAANMLYVDWDKELAYLASLNVMQCEMKHDECRTVGIHLFTTYLDLQPILLTNCLKTALIVYIDVESGQNLYYTCTSEASHMPEKTVADGIKAWYKEIKDAETKNAANYSGVGINNKEINHFGQLAWGATHRVGCAMSRYRYDYYDETSGRTFPMKCDLFACNYAPMGNWLTTAMYKEGEPCSECPSKKCKTKYKLCKTEYKNSEKVPKTKKNPKSKKSKKSKRPKKSSKSKRSRRS